MPEYVDILGHPTWVSDSGGIGPVVLLLHGGLSNSDDLLETLGGALGVRYRLVAFDRRGHGRTADTDQPMHYEGMADEVIGVLETVVGGPAMTVGWSDGGIASLLAARKRPELIDGQVLIGTNFHYGGIESLDFGGPESPFVQQIAGDYAQRSPDGIEHFPVVAEKAMTMAATEPALAEAELAGIGVPTLVIAGDDDLITPEHTLALYRGLPQAQLSIVPGASHLLPLERPETVAAIILDFFERPVPPPTLMPFRRRPQSEE